MDVSIVTPSRNMLSYLQRCHASVMDQVGVDVEHLVMDACSEDGTPAWLAATPTARGRVERDSGMYDAINKGLRLASGEIVGYLNCDEQYLPNTLAFVKAYFAQHPAVEVLAGDTLLIRPDGSLIAYRKTYPLPSWLLRAAHLHVHSSSLFFRRSIVEEGHSFDPRWRDVGDLAFVVELQRHGHTFGYCRRYLSAFTMTGANMGAGDNAARERAAFARQCAPKLPGRTLALMLRRAIKLFSGAYFQRMPLEYAIYREGALSRRTIVHADRATWAWRFA